MKVKQESEATITPTRFLMYHIFHCVSTSNLMRARKSKSSTLSLSNTQKSTSREKVTRNDASYHRHPLHQNRHSHGNVDSFPAQKDFTKTEERQKDLQLKEYKRNTGLDS